ncbi:hypothetical protein [Cryptosporangium minutisporangium]|uniref:Uncharacterized protein n=1 Tax=Cryptosporangium minutisporangium TaxID=113569 RepID=A0ABP6TA62_9ACTN
MPGDLDELLRLHEARQALAARAAYSLLRISAAVPPDHRAVVGAADAGQRAGAWLAGVSTNPGRWTSRAVLAAEVTELDVLLADLRAHLIVVLDWLSVHLGAQVARAGLTHSIRVPRTLLAECTALVDDLADLIPAAAA